VISMNDPKQLFVISTISRRDIANALNDAIDNAASDVPKFKPNDPRLTDEACRAFAAQVHEEDMTVLNVEDSNEWAARTILITYEPEWKKPIRKPAKRRAR